MKKGEIYEAIVEKVEFPNKGIVHVGEEKVIVKNAIPGQKIQFVINKKRNGKCEGRLLEVLEASELERKEGACPHFGRMRRLSVPEPSIRRTVKDQRGTDQITFRQCVQVL